MPGDSGEEEETEPIAHDPAKSLNTQTELPDLGSSQGVMTRQGRYVAVNTGEVSPRNEEPAESEVPRKKNGREPIQSVFAGEDRQPQVESSLGGSDLPSDRGNRTQATPNLLAPSVALTMCQIVDAIETLAIGSVLVSYVDPDGGVRLDQEKILAGFITSGVFMGMLLGSTISGRLADKYGRRPVLIFSMLIVFAAGFLSGLCTFFSGRQVFWLLGLRIISGIGVGGSIPCTYSLMAEWSDPSVRGLKVSILTAMWTVGAAFVTFMAWILMSPDDNIDDWPLFLFICSMPSLLASFLTYTYVFDKPNHKLADSTGTYAHELEMESEEGPLTSKPPPTHEAGALHRCQNRFAVVFHGMVWFALSFGSYGVATWIGDVFEKLGYEDPYGVALLYALGAVPGNVIAINLVEQVGRKVLLCMGLITSGLAAFGFSLATGFPAIVTTCACIFAGTVQLSWVALSVMSSEAFPFKVRTTYMGIVAGVGRIGSITANISNSFLIMYDLVLVGAGVVLITGGIVSIVFLVDKTGQALDD